jgi:hypothetical protein
MRTLMSAATALQVLLRTPRVVLRVAVDHVAFVMFAALRVVR